jgi:hypothetical protein
MWPRRRHANKILPAVRNCAGNAFRHWNENEKEEAIAEIVALAWRHFIYAISAGHDPLSSIGYIAKINTKTFRAFNLITGRMSGVDALSRRTKIDRDIKVVSDSQSLQLLKDDGFEGFLYSATGGTAANYQPGTFDFEEWKAELPAGLQEFADYLARQNDIADVAERFDLTPAAVQGLRDNLASRYLAYLNR